MARMSGAEWLGEHGAGSGLMSRYDILCIHTIVGFAPAHAAHLSTKASGHISQSRDTLYRSAANLNGNHRIIAVENEDHGSSFGPWNTQDGHAVPTFTPQQCEALAHIIVWAYRTHGIPIQPCPDSKPGSRGVAYHRQGIDGNFGGYAYGGRVSGGELWTEHFGKVCPGDRRITQLISTIIPRARVLAGLDQPQGDAMYDTAQNDRDWDTAYRVRDFTHGHVRVQDDAPRIAGEVLNSNLGKAAAEWRLHRALQLNPTLGSGIPELDNGEALPLVDLLKRVDANVVNLQSALIAAVQAAVQDYLTNNPPTVQVDVQAIARAVLDEDHRRSAA